MIAHTDKIYSRPKRTWFATEKKKKALAKVAKGSDVVVPFFFTLFTFVVVVGVLFSLYLQY
jgi:hypothetical protein